jgi:hypothetical protein
VQKGALPDATRPVHEDGWSDRVVGEQILEKRQLLDAPDQPV